MSKTKTNVDKTLQKLWRTCVLLQAGNRCLLCGFKFSDAQLQCHHIIKRRYRVLRHDPMNGVALCIPCHTEAEKPWNAGKINERLGAERMAYLELLAGKLYKDFLAEYGMTDADWRAIEAGRLKEAIAFLQIPDIDRAGREVPGRLRLDVLA